MGPLALAYLAPYFWPCLIRANLKQWQEIQAGQVALLGRIIAATNQLQG